MTRQSVFLLVTAAGLTPIALSYVLVPDKSLSVLFDIDADTTNIRHIFRAVMGLYLALIVFWVAGARNETLRVPALWSLVVFMFGLAAGRAASLVVDGFPHLLLFVYLVLEILFGVTGLWLLRAMER
jgi:hypothetical protein